MTDEEQSWRHSTCTSRKQANDWEGQDTRSRLPQSCLADKPAGRKNLETGETSSTPFENGSGTSCSPVPTGHVCVVVNGKSDAFFRRCYLDFPYVHTEAIIKSFINGYSIIFVVGGHKELSSGNSEVVHAIANTDRDLLKHVEMSSLPAIQLYRGLVAHPFICEGQEGIPVYCKDFNVLGSIYWECLVQSKIGFL